MNDKFIIAKKGLTGVTGNIYCGLHEFEDMAFVLHYLRPEDLFVDIGANVGSYTILAGATGSSVLAIEPIPSTFKILQSNIGVNQFNGNVTAQNIGLASIPGELFFTNHMDTINHVVTTNSENSQVVKVDTIDNLLSKSAPSLIKMDVEGFEFEILKGGTSILASAHLDAIIVELNGSGQKYGHMDSDVVNLLNEYGFHQKRYQPTEKKILPFSGISATGNGLFIRNTVKVEERVANSDKYKIKSRYL